MESNQFRKVHEYKTCQAFYEDDGFVILSSTRVLLLFPFQPSAPFSRLNRHKFLCIARFKPCGPFLKEHFQSGAYLSRAILLATSVGLHNWRRSVSTRQTIKELVTLST
ncbi:hypothetical protein TWF694_006735 [Orbilia ellipsospora]|uniref:Uncharacterized protein n=1 Tax=Orbilia ellipsospora TaxID=2528407 RepID=A0AAV9XSR2_9PEZI